MDLNLQGLRRSPEWRKNLHGYITLEGVELSDGAVRKVVTQGHCGRVRKTQPNPRRTGKAMVEP